MQKYTKALIVLISSVLFQFVGVANAEVLGLNLKQGSNIVAVYNDKNLNHHLTMRGEYTFTMSSDKAFNNILITQTGLKVPIALINDTDNVYHTGEVFTKFDFVPSNIRKQSAETSLKQSDSMLASKAPIINGQTRATVYVPSASTFTLLFGLVKSNLNQAGLASANIVSRLGPTVDGIVSTYFNGEYFIISTNGGTFNLTASHVGYTQQTKYQYVPVGGTGTINFSLL